MPYMEGTVYELDDNAFAQNAGPNKYPNGLSFFRTSSNWTLPHTGATGDIDADSVANRVIVLTIRRGTYAFQFIQPEGVDSWVWVRTATSASAWGWETEIPNWYYIDDRYYRKAYIDALEARIEALET